MFTYGLENQMIDARWCEIAIYNKFTIYNFKQ